MNYRHAQVRLLAVVWLAVAAGCEVRETALQSGPRPSDTTADAGNFPSEKRSEITPVAYAAAADAAGWGDFAGRFSIKGAPKPGKVDINKDEAYCGPFKLVDESLVVGKTGGLANAVVMLNIKRNAPVPEIHESYAADEKAVISLDNFRCRFEPRIVVLRDTQTLEVRNSDPEPIAHNAKIEANPPINPILAPGKSVKAQFKASRLPSPVTCSIHPWMKAYLVVKETPYVAVTDDNGEFSIKNLPAGEWEFRIWHEQLAYIREVTVGGKQQSWNQGLVIVPIKSGETTNLGEVQIDYATHPRE